jgi:hypothetical protein
MANLTISIEVERESVHMRHRVEMQAPQLQTPNCRYRYR